MKGVWAVAVARVTGVTRELEALYKDTSVCLQSFGHFPCTLNLYCKELVSLR